MNLLKYLFTNDQNKKQKLEDGTFNIFCCQDKIEECFENERDIWTTIRFVLDFNERECTCFDYCDCFDRDSDDYLANSNAPCLCYCSCKWIQIYPTDIPKPIRLNIEQKKELIMLLASKGIPLRYCEIDLERNNIELNFKPKTDFDTFLAEYFCLSQEEMNKLAVDKENASLVKMTTNFNILRVLPS